jgi:hypothetical protein
MSHCIIIYRKNNNNGCFNFESNIKNFIFCDLKECFEKYEQKLLDEFILNKQSAPTQYITDHYVKLFSPLSTLYSTKNNDGILLFSTMRVFSHNINSIENFLCSKQSFNGKYLHCIIFKTDKILFIHENYLKNHSLTENLLDIKSRFNSNAGKCFLVPFDYNMENLKYSINDNKSSILLHKLFFGEIFDCIVQAKKIEFRENNENVLIDNVKINFETDGENIKINKDLKSIYNCQTISFVGSSRLFFLLSSETVIHYNPTKEINPKYENNVITNNDDDMQYIYYFIDVHYLDHPELKIFNIEENIFEKLFLGYPKECVDDFEYKSYLFHKKNIEIIPKMNMGTVNIISNNLIVKSFFSLTILNTNEFHAIVFKKSDQIHINPLITDINNEDYCIITKDELNNSIDDFEMFNEHEIIESSLFMSAQKAKELTDSTNKLHLFYTEQIFLLINKSVEKIEYDVNWIVPNDLKSNITLYNKIETFLMECNYKVTRKIVGDEEVFNISWK